MHDIVIYGAGGFGRETALMLEQINAVSNTWNVTGFYDDGLAKGTKIDGIPVLGGIAEVNKINQEMAMVVAIAEPVVRKKIVGDIKNENIHFPTVIHPQANVGSKMNCYGKGSIITAGCILTIHVTVGNFVIVNLAATVGHDAMLEDYCTIMPGSNISGNVKIGACTLIGTGAQILQNIAIGSNCKVGAGAVVTKSFKDNLTLVGVPASIKH